MVLVDTTVWIDFFSGKSLPHVQALEDQILAKQDICICGFVLTEVLQGIRDDAQHRKTKDYFQSLTYLSTKKETFESAAEIYRHLRKKGITIRKTIDCMIAAVAIENGLPLLHNDCDFDQIARQTKLKVLTMG